LFEKRKWE
jgi:hypothetical protein